MKIIICTYLVFMSFSIIGQDLHLSQFYTNQMAINPALAGAYQGTYRFSGNYRNQWREINKPLNTVFLALDRKFFHHSDEFSVGVLFNDDQFAGFNQKTTKLFINGSYIKKLGLNTVSAGVQFGTVLKSTDLSTQTFPNQWVYTEGVFDEKVSNGEVNLASNHAFFDMNIGISWSKKIKNFKPLIGFSLFHVNRPKAALNNPVFERLRMRKAFFIDADWRFKNNISIEPKVLYMWTTKTQDLVVGTTFKKHFESKTIQNIYFGFVARTGINRNIDAVIPIFGFNIKRFDIGFSYDINVSELSQYNAKKSSLEWSLNYIIPIYNPTKLSIPCDRY